MHQPFFDIIIGKSSILNIQDDATTENAISRISAFGTLVGGLIGPIIALISVILLYLTFIKNKEVYIRQQFDNVFFESYKSYQQSKITLNNLVRSKNFLRNKMHRLISTCHTRGQQSSRDFVIISQVANVVEFSTYYRLLYRLFDQLDQADIKEKERPIYAKLVRAQLDEYELFFLRYNANTVEGENFKKHINDYNLLKHLPLFNLLEFAEYRVKLNNDITNINGLNTLYFELRKNIKRALNEKQNLEITKSSGRYKFYIYPEKGSVKLEMRINLDLIGTNDILSGFDSLIAPLNPDYDTIAAILKSFMKELFIESNFEQFNKPLNTLIQIVTNESDTENGMRIRKIVVTVSTHNKKLRYKSKRFS